MRGEASASIAWIDALKQYGSTEIRHAMLEWGQVAAMDESWERGGWGRFGMR